MGLNDVFWAIIIFVIPVIFCVGMFNPKLVVLWGKPEIKNRNTVFGICFLIGIVCILGSLSIALTNEKSDKVVLQEQEKSDKVVLQEQEKADKVLLQEQVQQKQQKPIIELPKTVEELPVYLNGFLPDEGKNKVYVIASDNYKGMYMVHCEFTLEDGIWLESKAKEIAKKFIFASYNATYKSKLPIVYSSIVMLQPNGRLGLSVGLGKKGADSQGENIWADEKMGYTIFMDWLKNNKNNSKDFATRCTYLGEFAK